jgi:hypothetical protein
MLSLSSSSSIEKVSDTAIVFVGIVIVEGMQEEIPVGGGGGILAIVGAAETKVDGPPLTTLVGFEVSMIL